MKGFHVHVWKQRRFWVGLISMLLAAASVTFLWVNFLADQVTGLKVSQVQQLAGYILVDGNTLHVDEVEVITTVDADQILGLSLHDPKRIEELGLREEDMPNGYVVHHPDAETLSFELTDETVYSFTDVQLLFVEQADGNRHYETTNKEDFLRHLRASYTDTPPAGRVPFIIEVQDGKVVRITEKLLLTQ